MPDKIAAHVIVHEGKRHKLSSARIDESGHIVIEPLVAETPRTLFINGEVEVAIIDGSIYAKPCSKGQEPLSHKSC